MQSQPERIPVPWPQRWEFVRERIVPVLCLALTLVACGWLWNRQASFAPVALGEVRSEWLEVTSPCDGQVLPIEGAAEGHWPLFAKVVRGDVAARVQCSESPDDIAVVTAPIDGAVTAVYAFAGQAVRAGDAILKITSAQPKYIVCHVPDVAGATLERGLAAAIRPQRRGARWTWTVVDAVGPAVEPAPSLQNGEAQSHQRGLPVRIAIPKLADVRLMPGSLVEVRFAPATAGRSGTN